MWLFIIPILASIWLLNIGLRLLFQKGYVEKRYGTNEEKGEWISLSKEKVFFYNKYIRGFIYSLAGIGILIESALAMYYSFNI